MKQNLTIHWALTLTRVVSFPYLFLDCGWAQDSVIEKYVTKLLGCEVHTAYWTSVP